LRGAGLAAAPSTAELAAKLEGLSTGAAAAQQPLRAGRRPQWLLFNDFAISPMPAEEVRRLYDGQKVPVLLYYSRVRPKPLRPRKNVSGLLYNSRVRRNVRCINARLLLQAGLSMLRQPASHEPVQACGYGMPCCNSVTR
jgi:hypothetical protein